MFKIRKSDVYALGTQATMVNVYIIFTLMAQFEKLGGDVPWLKVTKSPKCMGGFLAQSNKKCQILAKMAKIFENTRKT